MEFSQHFATHGFPTACQQMPKMSAGETLDSALAVYCLDERSLGNKQTFWASSAIYTAVHLSSGKSSRYMLYDIKKDSKMNFCCNVLTDSHEDYPGCYSRRKTALQNRNTFINQTRQYTRKKEIFTGLVF